jgi:hypothetical protein
MIVNVESDTHNVANFVCDLEIVIQNNLIKICILNNVCDVKFYYIKSYCYTTLYFM